MSAVSVIRSGIRQVKPGQRADPPNRLHFGGSCARAGLGRKIGQGITGRVRNVAGDRRRRFYRIECRRRAERGRSRRCRGLRSARPEGKWRNLAKRQLVDIVPPAELLDWLKGRKLDAVIHLGAISETTATDGDLVIETNFRLSMRLLDWCTANATPFIYASSAATYGDGAARLWRRRLAAGAEETAADESLRLEQAPVRSSRSPSASRAARSCRRNGRD